MVRTTLLPSPKVVLAPSARTLLALKPMAGTLMSNVGTPFAMPRKVMVPLVPLFAADTVVEVACTAGPKRPNTVPTGGRLVVKLKVADAIATLALSGAPMDTVGVVVVVEPVLPDVLPVVLPDELPAVLFAPVFSAAPPPPPPPEQAAKASRQKDDTRRAAFLDASMTPPVLVRSHGISQPHVQTLPGP